MQPVLVATKQRIQGSPMPDWNLFVHPDTVDAGVSAGIRRKGFCCRETSQFLRHSVHELKQQNRSSGRIVALDIGANIGYHCRARQARLPRRGLGAAAAQLPSARRQRPNAQPRRLGGARAAWRVRGALAGGRGPHVRALDGHDDDRRRRAAHRVEDGRGEGRATAGRPRQRRARKTRPDAG